MYTDAEIIYSNVKKWKKKNTESRGKRKPGTG